MSSDHLPYWHDVPTSEWTGWNACFVAEPASPVLKAACPLCSQVALKQYYMKPLQRNGIGAGWQLCSACKAYSHFSCRVAEEWNFKMEITGHLTPLPDALEDALLRIFQGGESG